MADFTNILITGASSGLGEGLALSYARTGVRLFLSGRDAQRVEAVAGACRAKGAAAEGTVIDVADRPAMAQWITACDGKAGLDLVVANAGIGAERPVGSAEGAEALMAVNVLGVLNTAIPAIEAMRPRGRGQIALVSSLAGFRGLPVQPAYCASKAAVRVWGEGMRLPLAKAGIGLTVICPGFVRTRMTEGNRFPMPFLLDSEAAVRLMRQGIEANRPRVVFPWPLALGVRLFSALPPAWGDALLRRAGIG